MRFSDIIGLEEQKEILRASLHKNHVAHAQLFHGNEGSGNLALALAFGAYVNCENPAETDSCGKCASCVKIDKLIHPDVSFIFPTAGGKKVLSENFMAEWRSFVLENPYGNSTDWLEKIGIKQGNIPVEEARKLIQNLSLKAFEARYKLVYIWLPEYFNSGTANALLKILEEPPSNTLFLLVCNHSDTLLTTIISRTQRFAVPKFTEKDVVSFLIQNGINKERAEEIAGLANGNLRQALAISNARNETQHDWFARWMRFCYGFNVTELVAFADEFDTLTKEQQKQVLEYALTVFREIFLIAAGNTDLVKLEHKPLEFVQNFSKVFNVNNLSVISSQVDEAIYHIERNVRSKIVFLDLSLHLARLIK
jgi:DNA polymerase-3 subunit delta'